MPRVRQHVNPLKSDLLEIAGVPRVEAPAGAALDVELGCAEAHFLIDLARADRETALVGVEIRRELVTFTNEELGKAGLDNVRLVFANMSVDMPRLFADASVRRFFLNFPDPWFKTRQHKRRVMGPELVAEIDRALRPDGELFVQTDIFDLALEAMSAVEGAVPARFVNVHAPWSFLPANPYPAKSRRERQCEGDGTRIWRLLYRRNS
ncbi:MAG TPA: methyltransferase domain-containing protein [Polyangia bacterium]|nr:methyltransferase domain-containing protein [Polyangia bacterium]